VNSKEIKKIILEHIINSCPNEVWEFSWNRRKHLTEADIDKSKTPDSVSSICQIVWDEKTRRLSYPTIEDWKKYSIDHCYRKGKLTTDYITRLSKKKNKNKEIIRIFGFGCLDHYIVVTTDPEDQKIISIEYQRTNK
jgi:hypothetical protein